MLKTFRTNLIENNSPEWKFQDKLFLDHDKNKKYSLVFVCWDYDSANANDHAGEVAIDASAEFFSGPTALLAQDFALVDLAKKEIPNAKLSLQIEWKAFGNKAA